MLSRFYLYFAGVNAALALGAVLAAMAGWGTAAGPWEPWPHPPLLEWTYLGAAAWSFLILRVILSIAAWQALKERADCGRPLAIVAAIAAFTQFPIGLVLGAFTLVKLAGKRSASLYTASMRA